MILLQSFCEKCYLLCYNKCTKIQKKFILIFNLNLLPIGHCINSIFKILFLKLSSYVRNSLQMIFIVQYYLHLRELPE